MSAALGRRSEELYEGLPAAGQEAARQLMLRLVSVDEHSDDTRRRVRQSELESLDVDHAALDEVVRQFASYRLLTFDRDPLTRTPTIEVAHEALLREWDRLRRWIDDQRDDLVLHRRFSAALQEWTAADRADAFLLAGGRLHQFEAWAALTNLSLTADERELPRIGVGCTSAGAGDAGPGCAGAPCSCSAGWPRLRSPRAGPPSGRPPRRPPAASRARPRWRWPRIRSGASCSGWSRSGTPNGQASRYCRSRSGLCSTRCRPRGSKLASTAAGGPSRPVPTGRYSPRDSIDLDTLSLSEDVVVWDADRGAPLRTLTGEARVAESTGTDVFPHTLAFSPDGGMLAVAYAAPETGVASIALWDPHTGDIRRRIEVPGSVAWNPVWSADGRLLAAAIWDGTANTVLVWEAATGRRVTSFHPSFVGEMALYDESTLAITLGPAGGVGFYDLGTGAELDRLETPGIEPAYLAVDSPRHQWWWRRATSSYRCGMSTHAR